MISEVISAAQNLIEVYQRQQLARKFRRDTRAYFREQRAKAQEDDSRYRFTFSDEYRKLQEDAGIDDPTETLPLIEQYERDLKRAIYQYRELALAAVSIAIKESAVRESDDEGTWITLSEEVKKPAINVQSYSAILNAVALQVQAENRKIIELRTKEGYFKGVRFSQRGLHPYGIRVAFKLPYDKSVISALQARNTGAFKGVTDDMGKEIIRSLSEGAMNGEDIRKLTKRVEAVVDGIGPARAETIARTELMKSVNQGIRSRYESSGVTKMRRIETKDERVCTDWPFVVGGRTYNGCKAIDGQVFTLSEAAEIDMQSHPKCRGTWAPVIEGLSKAAA